MTIYVSATQDNNGNWGYSDGDVDSNGQQIYGTQTYKPEEIGEMLKRITDLVTAHTESTANSESSER